MLDGGHNSSDMGAESFTRHSSVPTARKRKNKNQRRFSDDQIKSLESMFESETKLEPRKKLQLASELGLQPRQVAIWFQNKRARWKSKQLEREHCILLSKYNTLASQLEMLKDEKQSLIMQLQSLNNLIRDKSQCSREGPQVYGIDGESDDGGDTTKCELKENPVFGVELDEHGMSVPSDEDSSIKAGYFGMEEPTLLDVPAENSMTSAENWGNLEAQDLLDQSTSSYPWWDFWS